MGTHVHLGDLCSLSAREAAFLDPAVIVLSPERAIGVRERTEQRPTLPSSLRDLLEVISDPYHDMFGCCGGNQTQHSRKTVENYGL